MYRNKATITYFTKAVVWKAGISLLYVRLSAGILNIFKIKYTILLLFKYIVSFKLESPFHGIMFNDKTTITWIFFMSAKEMYKKVSL